MKFNKENDNLISAHATHNMYTFMIRIFKSYDFELKLNKKKLNNFKYSSRPGDLNSKDDYYTLSNKIVIMETSLHIYDLSLYSNLSYKTVPKWIRVTVANRLASNNLEWIKIFFKYNSGTHCNQWLIVDYNKFEESIKNKNQKNLTEEIYDNIIHLVEQIPVLDKAYYKDLSSVLMEDGYVASFNAPYFDEVKELAGYNSHNKSDYFSARRFSLFKNFANSTNSVDEVKELMRYHDNENICDTIAPRCDVDGSRPFGAIDAKLTDSAMLPEMKSNIVYGPPHIKGISEPFDFSKYPNYSHLGIPEYFDFKWIDA